MALDTGGKRLDRSFEMSNSLLIYLDLWFYGWIWTLKRLSLPYFRRKISATKSMDEISVTCKNAPKNYRKNPKVSTCPHLSQDTIIIMGFIPAPKGKTALQPASILGLVLHETTEASGSSSLKKKGAEI